MTDLTPARLAELLAAATPGPWKQHLVDETLVVSGLLEIASTNIDGRAYDESFRRMAADAALIALCPSLAARVIELEDGLQRIADADLDWTVGAADNVERLRRIARTALGTPNAD